MPLFILLLFCDAGCSDCSTNSTRPANAVDGGNPLLLGQSAPFSKSPRLLDGELDLKNHYASTVRVNVNSPEVHQECSGVLIDPRLVLTSAHCVCASRNARTSGNEDKVLFDNSTCAIAATVTAIAYLPPLPDGAVSSLNAAYRGAIRPHPDFRLTLDAQGSVEASRADLALIVLSRPAAGPFPPVKLADTEADTSESLVTAGYGDDDSSSGSYDDRRFSKHRVVRLPEAGGDLIVLTPPARPAYQNDSGGPCLREAGAAQTLVGISQRGLGKESTCTSTSIYKAWLSEELRHAVPPDPSPPP